jgi:hypothetical protein
MSMSFIESEVSQCFTIMNWNGSASKDLLPQGCQNSTQTYDFQILECGLSCPKQKKVMGCSTTVPLQCQL